MCLTTNSSWLPWKGLPCLSSALWCQYPKVHCLCCHKYIDNYSSRVVHSIAYLAVLSSFVRSVCLSKFHFLLLTCSWPDLEFSGFVNVIRVKIMRVGIGKGIGAWHRCLVNVFVKSLFVFFSGKCTLTIQHINLLIKLVAYLPFSQLVSKTTEAYSSKTAFTLELNILILVVVPTILNFHNLYVALKTDLARPV